MSETTTDAENDFALTAKSSVKLIKNSKGINWEIKVVKGEESLIHALKDKALEVHNDFLRIIDKTSSGGKEK